MAVALDVDITWRSLLQLCRQPVGKKAARYTVENLRRAGRLVPVPGLTQPTGGRGRPLRVYRPVELA